MITFTEGKLHWNYFLALERDMEQVSRYVEFCKANERVFSIELAHLLFAAAAEAEVVGKLLCKRIDNSVRTDRINMDGIRQVLHSHFPGMHQERVHISRYGMDYLPLEKWPDGENPVWWRSYNKVKHTRHQYFNRAHLKNALNALGGLLILEFYYYKHCMTEAWNGTRPLSEKQVNEELQPQSTLLRLSSDYYYEVIVDG